MVADGERLAIVTSLSERIAAVAATAPGEGDRVTDAPRRGKADHGFDRISNVAMHALARRGMSSREMHAYLVGREFAEDAAAGEVERLESVGLLDDLQLAETLVRMLRQRKGLGRTALRAELSRRLLDPDAIAAALEQLDDDDQSLALEVATKRAAQLRSYDHETAMRRLVSFLLRKGYSSGIATRAAQTALGLSRGGGPVFR